eukprot:m.341518 g.341518  ORF g.341518 m.341518 type:complete len:393 (+) comp20162_c0_seq1:210-1388(+)
MMTSFFRVFYIVTLHLLCGLPGSQSLWKWPTNCVGEFECVGTSGPCRHVTEHTCQPFTDKTYEICPPDHIKCGSTACGECENGIGLCRTAAPHPSSMCFPESKVQRVVGNTGLVCSRCPHDVIDCHEPVDQKCTDCNQEQRLSFQQACERGNNFEDWNTPVFKAVFGSIPEGSDCMYNQKDFPEMVIYQEDLFQSAWKGICKSFDPTTGKCPSGYSQCEEFLYEGSIKPWSDESNPDRACSREKALEGAKCGCAAGSRCFNCFTKNGGACIETEGECEQYGHKTCGASKIVVPSVTASNEVDSEGDDQTNKQLGSSGMTYIIVGVCALILVGALVVMGRNGTFGQMWRKIKTTKYNVARRNNRTEPSNLVHNRAYVPHGLDYIMHGSNDKDD